ncbi:MAG: DUF1016 domain-containing protein, partial [Candidatus Gastranaerophilales bacterium]|nr:DUF1016 domain-containing protein [Candidatus Gastranaerophilales bacterium]
MAELIENSFNEVVSLIQKARNNALKSVNRELITLYWQVGEYISGKIEFASWGENTIKSLADYIQQNQPDIKGFSASNIWRMKQFYELYRNNEKLATLLREISWSNNLLVMAKTKTDEEREFYLKLAIKEGYSYRELERQLNSCYYERCLSSGKLLPAKLEEIHPQAKE